MRKKENLASVGVLLIIGGCSAIRFAGRMQSIANSYGHGGAGGTNVLGSCLGWMILISGVVSLLFSFARWLGEKPDDNRSRY